MASTATCSILNETHATEFNAACNTMSGSYASALNSLTGEAHIRRIAAVMAENNSSRHATCGIPPSPPPSLSPRSKNRRWGKTELAAAATVEHTPCTDVDSVVAASRSPASSSTAAPSAREIPNAAAAATHAAFRRASSSSSAATSAAPPSSSWLATAFPNRLLCRALLFPRLFLLAFFLLEEGPLPPVPPLLRWPPAPTPKAAARISPAVSDTDADSKMLARYWNAAAWARGDCCCREGCKYETAS
mmetsp:Transcript_13181/g.25175  ORF Transcript_13181/g.25175 Transcript_13181/m.25175 type:complete len:247 (+) Transcript_13181:2399-3139(+)